MKISFQLNTKPKYNITFKYDNETSQSGTYSLDDQKAICAFSKISINNNNIVVLDPENRIQAVISLDQYNPVFKNK